MDKEKLEENSQTGMFLVVKFHPKYIEHIIDEFEIETQRELETYLAGRSGSIIKSFGDEIDFWIIHTEGEENG